MRQYRRPRSLSLRSGLQAAAGILLAMAVLAAATVPVGASYSNFESPQVHPIALTPDGTRLLVVNTPDALLEVFDVAKGGGLSLSASIPVGLEPVTVAARGDTEAWVVNWLSDSISVVDLTTETVTRTLTTGDEPGDVTFAGGRAFVSCGGADRLDVFNLGNLDAAPTPLPIGARRPRALATDGTNVYVVVLFSGNRTTVVNANVIFGSGLTLDGGRLTALGLNQVECSGPAPNYPPLPGGVTRNPALTDPPSGVPEVGLIVRWNESNGTWEDDAGTNWNKCVPYRVADNDLFVVNASTLAVSTVEGLGTSLFDVSVRPGGKIYVPNTDARNEVRFEHENGVRGHVVDNRLSVIDPADGNAVTLIDLNTHINRSSDPATNLAERSASISQPGMLVWNGDGSVGWMTGIGSRKLFKVDGSCLAGPCIFGGTRATPQAVEVGEGPSGVALLDSADRAYVLNRFTNSVAVVDTAALLKIDEIALHDPSPAAVLDGRRFLYDSILGSGHGDAACSSCHLFGDRDDLAWDLGDPEGDLAPYSGSGDNVRFIIPLGGVPIECDPAICASHDGFDPQKGPMTTQTLRGMLEPLHWRGDRGTMNDFNPAFVGLMGTADQGPINGKPAGLSATDMEAYRQFALGIQYPPNPHRLTDDMLPCGPRSTDPTCEVAVPRSNFDGNPTEGELIFDTGNTDAGQPCVSCHTHPFGAAGGTLGGVTPQEPTASSAAALFNGDADGAPHHDLKVPHLRNMYEKRGPVYDSDFVNPATTETGFGFTHDGALPDLGTFFSASVFTLTERDVRDISAFMMYFPTGTKPAVGRNLTVPQGTPPTAPAADEALLTLLVTLGDLANPGRHCELVASAPFGPRIRRFHYSGSSWQPDVLGDPALTTTELREGADGPVSFVCATLGAGLRLGGDRDLDGFLDGDDCATGDGDTWLDATEISGFEIAGSGTTTLSWAAQNPDPGPSLRYEVLSGELAVLVASGLETATGCLADDLSGTVFDDTRPGPAPGTGWFYLIRGENPCGSGPAGPGRAGLDGLECVP